MPSTYAHYQFGKDVLAELPSPVQKVITAYRELYDIGLHGPDILFYYLNDFRRGPVNAQGSSLHKQMGDEFFGHGVEVAKNEPHPAAARAYMYGFICHFALDSECHGYVEKMIQTSGISHNEIEMEFDRFLMVRDGIDPLTHLGTNHIHPRMRNAKVIAPFFEDLTPRQVEDTLKGMIYCHKAFLAPGHIKRTALFATLKVVGDYDSLHGIVMSREPNPVCQPYNEILLRQYDGAVQVAVDLIHNFLCAVANGAPLDERFHQTFSAGEDWESLSL